MSGIGLQNPDLPHAIKKYSLSAGSRSVVWCAASLTSRLSLLCRHVPDPMLLEMMSPGYSELHDGSVPAPVPVSAGGAPPEVPPPPPPAPQYHQSQAQFEADKRAVYEHPLFPLLALLLEKCELATQTADVCSAETFSADVQAFIQHQQRDRKPFLIDQPEVDQLVSRDEKRG